MMTAQPSRLGGAEPNVAPREGLEGGALLNGKLVAGPPSRPPTWSGVYVSEQKRGVTVAIKRDPKRRSAVEPVIGT
jgi:hypothetical protein